MLIGGALYDGNTDPDLSAWDGPCGSTRDVSGVSLRADQQLGELTLTSITAYRERETEFLTDRDFTGLPILATGQFAPDLKSLKSILAESINHGDSVRCRLELEAWTHSLGNEPLRTRLLDNTRHLRDAIASALDAMRGREMLRLRVEPAVAAEIVTCFAFGAIASSALAAPASRSTVDAALNSLFDLVVEEPASCQTG